MELKSRRVVCDPGKVCGTRPATLHGGVNHSSCFFFRRFLNTFKHFFFLPPPLPPQFEQARLICPPTRSVPHVSVKPVQTTAEAFGAGDEAVVARRSLA